MRVLVLALFSLLVITPSAQALGIPNATFIPPQISANSSFVMLADAQSGDSSRIMWRVFVGDVNFGLVPKVDGKWFCYFSNTDPAASCGPTPFTVQSSIAGPYALQLDAINTFGDKTTASQNINVGGITLTPEVTIENGKAFMVVFPSGGLPTGISYAVFAKDLKQISPGYIPLEKNTKTGFFTGNVALDPGEYFFAFSAVSATDFGGGLVPVTVEGGGTTNQTNNTNQFSIEADDVSFSAFITPNQRLERTGFTLTNKGSSVLKDMKISTPGDTGRFVTIALQNTSIGINDSVLFTVVLHDISSSTTINTKADIVSGFTKVGELQLTIPVTVQGSTSSGSPLTVSPGSLSGEFLVGAPVTREFTVTNNGGSDVSNLKSATTGSLSSITEVTLPSVIAKQATGKVTVTLDPSSSGKYDGTLTLSSGGFSADIVMFTEFFDDVSTDISTLESDFSSAKTGLSSSISSSLGDVLDNIDDALKSAQTNFDSGNYQAAQRKAIEASAQIQVLKELATTGGTPTTACDDYLDVTTCQSAGCEWREDFSFCVESTGQTSGGPNFILLGIAFVIIILVVFVYFKKFRKGFSKELDEEFEEEELPPQESEMQDFT